MHSQVNELLLICLDECNILPIIWVAAKYISFSCKNNTLKMNKRRLVLFQESEKIVVSIYSLEGFRPVSPSPPEE